MSKSRETLCDIIDEALLTFDELEELDGFVSEPVKNTSTASSLELVNASRNVINGEQICVPEASINAKFRQLSEKPSKKRSSWKKPKDKPKRPLSAYNLFFRFEREHIISGGDERPSQEEIKAMIKATNNRPPPTEKRKHRKTHGKVSFQNLARSIADRWKALDKETREVFEKEANIERTRYKKEVEEWNRKRNEAGGQMTASVATPIQKSHHVSTSVPNFDIEVTKFMMPNSITQSKRPLNPTSMTAFNIHECHENDGRLNGQLFEENKTFLSDEFYPSSTYCFSYGSSTTQPGGRSDSTTCNCVISCADPQFCEMASVRFTHWQSFELSPTTTIDHSQESTKSKAPLLFPNMDGGLDETHQKGFDLNCCPVEYGGASGYKPTISADELKSWGIF